MCFFTYTELIVALFTSGDTFCPAFHTMQINMVAMLVNLGLVVMLLFDFTSKHEHIHRGWAWTVVGALMLALFIYFHCVITANKTHQGLVFPLSYDDFSIVMFGIFLVIVFVLKTYVEFDSVIKVTERK